MKAKSLFVATITFIVLTKKSESCHSAEDTSCLIWQTLKKTRAQCLPIQQDPFQTVCIFSNCSVQMKMDLVNCCNTQGKTNVAPIVGYLVRCTLIKVNILYIYVVVNVIYECFLKS